MTDESTAAVVVERDGRLAVQVPMTMEAAAAVLAAAAPYVRQADCVLDLADVPVVDSAALSVVLSLLRVSREAGHRLSLVGAPAAFGSLAALYGIDELIAEHLYVSTSAAHA